MDPTNLPKRMTKLQLEWWILFGICVAGKSAKGTEKKLTALLDDMQSLMSETSSSPFTLVRTAIERGRLGHLLRKHKMGKYTLFNKAFRAAVQIDLDTITIQSLEKVPGIGPKTARMTILYYEPEVDCVPLDTHILKWLKLHGYDAPKSTPQSGKRYLELEKAFIAEAKKRGKSVREFDTEVWQSYRI